MEWTSTIGEHTYGTSLWPLLISLLGVAATTAGFVLFGNRSRGVARSDRRLGLSCAVPLVLLVILLSGVSDFLSCAGCLDGALLGGRDRTGWALFTGLFLLEHLCIFVTTILTAATLYLRFSLGSERKSTPGLGLVGLAIFGWVLSLAGLAHVTYVADLGKLPRISDNLAEWVHVGQPASSHPRTRWGRRGKRSLTLTNLEAWTPSGDARVDTSEVGETTVELVLERPLLSVRRRRSLQVRPEKGDPSFPLAVGNRWIYAEHKTRTDSMWKGVQHHGAFLTLEIARARVHNGIRQFAVERRAEERSDVVWLYAVDGRTFVHEDDGDRIRSRNEDSEDYGLLKLPAVGSRETFQFPLLEGECVGISEVDGSIQVPGPTQCSAERTSGPIGFLLAVFTLGAAAPGLSQTVHVQLVESHAGTSNERVSNEK